MQQKLEKRSLKTMGVALLTVASAFSASSLPTSFRTASADESSVEKNLSTLELSNQQRTSLKSAAKTLAELELKTEALELLAILTETDLNGRFKKDNQSLEKLIEQKLGESKDLSDSRKELKVKTVKRELEKFSKSLFEDVKEADFYTQERALEILARIDIESEEYQALLKAVEFKRRQAEDSSFDLNTINRSISKINSLNISNRIESGLLETDKAISVAIYTDRNNEIISLQSSVVNKEDLAVILHELLRATVLFHGITAQDWSLPKLGDLLKTDEKGEGVGITISTANGSIFYPIDNSNRHSPRLQANMLISDLVGRTLQDEKFKSLPLFIKIGLMDLVNREITQMNAGAVAEIRSAITPNSDKGINFRETSDFRTLMFSGPTGDINHEESKAVNSAEHSLYRLLDGQGAKEGLGRLAAVRYVQYLLENKYLRQFITQVAEQPASFADYVRILKDVTGKTVEEVQDDFNKWIKRLTEGSKERDTEKAVTSVGRSIAQSLEDWSNGLVSVKDPLNQTNTLGDITKQAREVLPVIQGARDNFFGRKLPLAVSALLCEGNRLHTFYSERHNGGSFTHHQDPNSDFYTLLGAFGSLWSSIGNDSRPIADQIKIDLGMVYHSLQYLRVDAELIGAHSNLKNASSVSMYVHGDTGYAIDKKVLFWPYNNMTNVPVRFGVFEGITESPDPAPGHIGYSSKIFFRGEISRDLEVRFYKINKAGERIPVPEITVLTPENDPHRYLEKEVAIIPKEKLDYDSIYEIEVSGTDFKTVVSRFSTESR
ncbi:MAG: hypothetical protein R3A13_10895 [Bdellovibrionota bacterium]